MNTLYRNDAPGEFPGSWYRATAEIPPPRPKLDGDARADVCVVGAGYTGLSAALELARRGFSVIVLDAHRAGFGASGRNGGQVSSGFNKDQRWIRDRVGGNAAQVLWDMGEAAKEQVRRHAETHAPEARYAPGVAHGAYTRAQAEELAREAEHLAKVHNYHAVETLDHDAMRAMVKTPRYTGGTLDWGAGHIHPLRYALGLARAAEAAGALIYEMTEATGVEDKTPARVQTPTGTVTADHIILAGNGYMPDLHPRVAARVMPINSFIAATEPLDDPRSILAQDIAVADS
ncbi:MAG: FAD-binding oxidoreductase, partial [Pseudomonadota bacterium]